MILDQLKSKQIEYMKSKDTERLGVLRYFLAQVRNKEIELRPQGKELDDEITFKIIRKLIKDRRELIEVYKASNRPDMLEKESAELKVLEEFAAYFPFELNLGPK